jgi:hypothetical protein
MPLAIRTNDYALRAFIDLNVRPRLNRPQVSSKSISNPGVSCYSKLEILLCGESPVSFGRTI